MNPVIGANLTVSGGFGVSVLGVTDSIGYFLLAVKPTNIGDSFTLAFTVSSDYGTLYITQNTLTVRVTSASGKKRFASGTATVAAITRPFYTIYGDKFDDFYISVSGINFKPSCIVYFKNYRDTPYVYLADLQYPVTGHTVIDTRFRLYDAERLSAVVSETGFTLPVSYTGEYTWMAWE